MSATAVLQGATALITGGAKRLGAACARSLAEQGVNVCIHYNNSEEPARALAEELRGFGVRTDIVPGDLSTTRNARFVFEEALKRMHEIDILINNASIFEESTLVDCTSEEILNNININALAPFELAREFAKQGRPGHIINFLDTRLLDYDKGHFAYHLSKRMLHTITNSMALEFAPAIQVNAIAPGLILPPEGESLAYLEKLAHTNPLNRYGKIEEITSAMLFLLTSTFVTGQIVFVDGGRHLKGRVYG